MTPEPYYCPVCGPEDDGKGLASVRGHIVSSGDDGHDWEELKDEVEGQADETNADTDEVDDDPDEGNETEDEENPESDDESDEDDTEDMPTPEELERQRSQQTDDSDDQQTTQPTSSSGGVGIPISLTTALVLAALVVSIVVVYRFRSGDDPGQPVQQESDEQPADTEISGKTDGPGGGLVPE
ncbi:hypothetical protein ACFR9U_17145 [Halorientalis brevis]|uniref:Uncharacterized protein n=1 Tax=Halorientalis brevis TaxID=1126241 RepID=A0ABD6CEJ4_9EURY|nr:hypothetical protein [Halorientalis brevis]